MAEYQGSKNEVVVINGEFVEYVKYYLVETKALDGYVLSDDVTEVVFEYVEGLLR